ncbi:MAG: protein translocase subunit SecE [Pirellulaceae bacterium]|nr:MAG: protein translocase subunit SecE [Pirellulaceae bacterium]
MVVKESAAAAASRPLVRELFTSGLYKRNQGRMVRQATCIAIWIFVAAGVWRFHDLVLESMLGEENRAAGYLITVALGACGFWFAYRLVNWPKFADFLISVEAELNKVSWPTQKELVRASIVVIFTILFLSLILFLYDALWKLVFGWLGIS